MRLVIDLQACQTEASAGRGVGRYSFEFARSLIKNQSGYDLRFALNGCYQDEAARLRRELAFFTPPNRFSEYSYSDPASVVGESSEFLRHAGQAIAACHWMRLQPDILHISHVFEGYRARAVMPEIPRCPGVMTTATLYDLIPLRLPELYLVDPGFKQWYLRHVGLLHEFDLLLAISESTRQDAIELLGLSPEKVVTIWAGAGTQFRVQRVQSEMRAQVLARTGIRSSFVMYTGGDDHRKNIKGLIRGYAALGAATRKSYQLAIVCHVQDARRAMYLDFARQCGLRDSEIVFTGFVSESDLVALYNLCDAFVFPSLYEGFGFPVLEAMACGAPVVAANNSSIWELVARPQALFDPADPESIAHSIGRVLSDTALATALREYGLERSSEFSWQSVAQRALSAFDALAGRLAEGRQKPIEVAQTVRKRLAVFTPLPPCRSGIADYNAAFLPFLKKHFEIDIFIDDYSVEDEFLNANFRILNHHEFVRRHSRYDAVLYEMGNSEFHAYMLDYLERFPGVVGLHDAYLSGLYGYLEYFAGQKGRYSAEMLAAHSTCARRFFAPAMKCADPVFKSMIELPATKRVLDSAIGVIAHSPFNLEVSRKHYPEGWAAPFRIIRQMVVPRNPISVARRNSMRSRLGYAEGDFVVTTFGHIAWTKMGDLLLEAFERCCAGSEAVLHLVFAGELSRDEFGQRLKHAAVHSTYANRIRITGFLSEQEYADYLAISDLAVQLRKSSRGGTPKGVLDCLSRGVPVIVNEDASYCDYPDDVVRKIAAQPNVSDIADAIRTLSADRELLDELVFKGRSMIEAHHRPEKIALEYAMAICEFADRSGVVAAMEADLRPSSCGTLELIFEQVLAEAERSLYSDSSKQYFLKQRILVDVSHIVSHDHGTGIQRVVRSMARALSCSQRPGVSFTFVCIDECGKLVVPREWLVSHGLLAETEAASDLAEVVFRGGDILVMLDSSWNEFDRFVPIFDSLRRVGGRIISVVYDILPVRMPEFFLPGGADWFRNWLERACNESDGVVCISRAVAEDVANYVRSHMRSAGKPLRLGWWHLGSDFDGGIQEAESGEPLFPPHRRTFLMVGTLEPRKGHREALDAFEVLWKRGVEVQLCIVGRPGWMVEDLLKRIGEHPENARRLFYFDELPDGGLADCYRQAAALLFPSHGEGFGLPMVEAAHHGTKIVASDLPVFREIAGDGAFYLRLQGAESLADQIEEWLELDSSGRAPLPGSVLRKTWMQSADDFLSVILDNGWCASIVLESRNDVVDRT